MADLTQEQCETALAELIFQSCDGDFDWAECLLFGKDCSKLIEQYLEKQRR